MDQPRCDTTVAWAALQGHFEAHGRSLYLREAFARDAGRFATFSLEAAGLFADLSKNLWDLKTRKLLVEMAREVGLEARRDAMLAGAPINTTEGRAVLHTALRAPRGQGPFSDEVHGVLEPRAPGLSNLVARHQQALADRQRCAGCVELGLLRIRDVVGEFVFADPPAGVSVMPSGECTKSDSCFSSS